MNLKSGQVRSSRESVRGLKQRHQLHQNILTKVAEEILIKQRMMLENATQIKTRGRRWITKAKWLLREMRGKHFIHSPRFIWSGYSSWSPSQRSTKEDFNSKKQKLSGQSTFRKQQTDRSYIKLLALANKLPAFRKTTVKHYTEDSTAVLPKLKSISVTVMRIFAGMEE